KRLGRSIRTLSYLSTKDFVVTGSGRFFGGRALLRLREHRERLLQNQILTRLQILGLPVAQSLGSQIDDHVGLHAALFDRLEIWIGVVADGHEDYAAAWQRDELLHD